MSEVSPQPIRQPADRWITLVLLNLLFGASIGQMAGTAIFAQPIKIEFGLSDSGVVFLISVVYAIVFVVASVPFGILTDKGNRRNLIAFSGALFSIMFALQGLASSYFLLLLTRVGVGVGHAGYGPPAISLVSDKFAPHRRATALSLLILGGSLGAWACFSGGGYLLGRYGWRTTMIVIGLISLAITAITFLVVREPVRGALDGIDNTVQPPPTTFRETLGFCYSQRSVFHTIMGAVLVNFWGFGLSWWAPALLTRSFDVPAGKAGAIIGPIHGVVGIVSIALSSALLLWLGRGDARKPLWFLAIMGVLTTLPAIAMIFMHSAGGAILMMWLFVPMVYIYSGPSYAAIGTALPPNMRGQATSIVYAVGNLASLAIAPLAVGFLSDLIAPHLSHPAESLRYAMLPLALTGFWGATHYWLASRHIREDNERIATLAHEETIAAVQHGPAPVASTA